VNAASRGHEHEFEPEYGLPERLPDGEKMLWQGAPDFKALAIRVFHLRKLALHFPGADCDPRQLSVRHQFVRFRRTVGHDLAGWRQPLSTVVATLAWLTHALRPTPRPIDVVMRIGIVLTLTFNLAAALH